MVKFYNELKADFKEIEPFDFYRLIFPEGELDKKNAFTKGKFTGIACEFTDTKKSNGSQVVRRFSITDDLECITNLLQSDNFIIISPISYVGKRRTTVNARVMYAFVMEIDNLLIDNKTGRADGYYDLIHQMKNGLLPMANYIVASGEGLHLYYLFDKPLILYSNVIKSLANYKRYITPQFWNRYITNSYKRDEMQFESAFQGFRLAGGVSKKGDRTKIFELSKDKVTIEYLNSFADKDNQIEIVYKSKLSLAEAKEKYPDWYDKRIVQKLNKNAWTCKRDLYDWWLREIKSGAKVGHRYYCLMMLSIYAIKAGIDYDELEKDCFSLLKPFDKMSDKDTNRFTKKDIVDALQCYQDRGLVTYPINSISKLSGIAIQKNKRNFRKQNIHLKRARAVQNIDYPDGEWRNKDGRPKGSKNKENKKEQLIKKFLAEHEDENLSVTEIARQLNVSRPTVYKYMKK